MKRWWNTGAATAPSPVPPADNGLRVLSAETLLAKMHHQEQLSAIKRCLSITEAAWKGHYLFAVERFAEFAQKLPASAYYHHEGEGGLLTHSLEALLSAMRISQGLVLPPKSPAEEILENGDRWRYGIFVTTLGHDLGKLIGNMQVVYRTPDADWTLWNAWHGPLPLDAEYRYRYHRPNSEDTVQKNLHELLAAPLLPRLLTTRASQWISTDRQLLWEMMTALSGNPGGIISKVVKDADQSSVRVDVNLKKSATPEGLATHIIAAFKKLAIEGGLKRNRPGAAFWIDSNDTWITSTTAFEAVKQQLLSDGHKGVPQAPQTLISMLEDAGWVVPNQADKGKSTWRVKVIDSDADWSYRFYFVRIRNTRLWDGDAPAPFSGELQVIDSKGKAIADSAPPTPVPAATEATPTESQVITPPDTPPLAPEPPPWIDPNAEGDPTAVETTPPDPPAKPAKPAKTKTPASKNRSTPSKGTKGATLRGQNESLCRRSAFFDWLLDGIDARDIRVNEKQAPIHVVGGHLAMVTPRIFEMFLKENPESGLHGGPDTQGQLRAVQKSVTRMNLHSRKDGQDFRKVFLVGTNRTKSVSALIFGPEYINGLGRFNDNPVAEL